MILNKDIIKTIEDNDLPLNDCLTYLFSVYFKTIPTYIPELIYNSVNALKIFEIDHNNEEVVWKQELFTDVKQEDVSEEWIKEYRQLFINAYKPKGGSLLECKKRMKDFLKEFPDVTKEEIMDATEEYIKNTDFKYLREAHYFIWKQIGASVKKSDRRYYLHEWVERIREEKNNPKNTDDVI